MSRCFGSRGALELFGSHGLQYLRYDLLGAIRDLLAPRASTDADPDELLTAAQVAEVLQVVPATVRAWIQSDALAGSRPGNGKQPGRTY
jgi:hypothetical protein